MKHLLRFILLLTPIVVAVNMYAQQATNTDPKQNYVTVNTPRTPESAGFEKYGAAQVNEFTGASSVSIPVYSLKSRFLEAPITLSYQATGVRVNQEASWVGLGWDLMAGGRITRETRGDVDFQSTSLHSPTNLATEMQKIFTKYGPGRENAVLTGATIKTNGTPGNTNPEFYNWTVIADMTRYGVGEPDIFRANFMGNSLTFYFDKSTVTTTTPNINPTIKFIGEQSTFQITYTLAGNQISTFTITDNSGIKYYFTQKEVTANSNGGSPVVPGNTTSAWLLTSMVHPSGDNIQFTYTNYGYSVPAFSIGSQLNWEAASGTATLPQDFHQNVAVQSPQYLTKIETEDVSVDFTLDTRTDLYGSGSRKLNQITVKDKQTNVVKKTATFNYSYFESNVANTCSTYLNTLSYNLSGFGLSGQDYLNYGNTRLRLDGVNVNDNTYQPPYQFYYNSTAVPGKYHYGQDHWGYFNGVSNGANGCSFMHLIPYTVMGQNILGNNTSALNSIGAPANLGISRECEPGFMQSMILNKVVYPTGGSSEFTYEPHSSTMVPSNNQITGGGLRVKTIKNYANSNLVNTTSYDYTDGKYMGIIQYFTTANEIIPCPGGNVGYFKLSSNGAINDNEILIGYGQTTITQTAPNGAQNGKLVKTFNKNTSGATYANGTGFDVAAPYMPPEEVNSYACTSGGGGSYPTWYMWLDPAHKGLPPTPSANLEGKMMKEEYFNNANTLLKSTTYAYQLANYNQNLYNIRAIQNRVSGFDILNCDNGQQVDDGILTCGKRPVLLYISPAKSYHTLTTSIAETNYLNNVPLTIQKNFTYDGQYQLKTEELINSDGTSTTTTYTYPYDHIATYNQGGGSSMLADMTYSKNIKTPVFTKTTTSNGAPVNYVNNHYHNPNTGIYVPDYTQLQVGGNTTETRMLYNSYDTYGNLQERQAPNGVKETYIWGYHNKYPVATILGADFATANALVNAAILNAPANDAALRTELNNLRTGLPNAMVTTYTYDHVFGVTSQTDPNGKTNYFNYDPMGRLWYIQDHDKNVVKRFAYNYAGQPATIQPVTALLSGLNSTTLPWNVTLNHTVTGSSSTYSIYPGGTSTVLSNVDMATYNMSFSPMYSSSTTVQLLINGATYTGTSFTVPNISITAPISFTLQPAPASGPCSYTTNSGYSSPTNSLGSNGSSADGYYVFFSTGGTLIPGSSYNIATINGGCRPSVTRTFTTSAAGRTWEVTVTPGGAMSVKITSGSPLSPNSTVSLSISYLL